MKKLVTFPRMGIYTDFFKEFMEDIGINIILPPPTSEDTIKWGCKHSSDMMCVVGDTNITIDGFTSKPIKDVKVGEKVLTHKREFKRVIRVFSRKYKGKILHVDCGGFLKFDITPEHPVLSVKRQNITCVNFQKHQLPTVCDPKLKDSFYCNANRKGCKNARGFINFTPTFNPINELKRGDFIVVPIPKIVKDVPSLNWKENYEKHVLKYKNNNFLYNEFTLRLLGYWLAEGSFICNRKKKIERVGICFTFSSKEKEYINEIENTIRNNFECSISRRNQKSTVTDLLVYSKTLADIFFYLCGEHCDKKKIHKDIMNLPPEKQLELLKGFFRGDGHLDNKGNYSCATVSKNLANQLFWIMIRNNIKPSFFGTQQLNRKFCYKLKIFDSKDISKIDKKLDIIDKKNVFRYVKTKNYILVPIKDKKEKDFDGKVYNLEVEDDHSYIANNLTVHNCYPFKITLGNFKEALEEAKRRNVKLTLLMWDSGGYCRLRHYWILHKLTLENQGYEFDIVPLKANAMSMINTFSKLGGVSNFKVIRIILKHLKKLKEIDKKSFKKGINVGIIGEIWTCVEPVVNYDIEEKLNKLGANVYNTVSLLDYLKETFHINFGKRKYKKKAETYLNGPIGGHGLENIWNLLWLIDNGIDGIIHILPLSCMPESTVEPIIDNICNEKDISLLRVAIDETDSEANVNTRVEAFIEMIDLKKSGINILETLKKEYPISNHLGIDVGSVSVKMVVINEKNDVLAKVYLPNEELISTIKKGLSEIYKQVGNIKIDSVGCTGSGRGFTKLLIGGDIVKTEIFSHMMGTLSYCPDARTIFDIGGEDAKIITLENGKWKDYVMNNICGAGTGSNIENIGRMMNIKAKDIGDVALRKKTDLNFPGKCGVLCQSAVVTSKNKGVSKEDILMGVCKGLINNFLTLAKSMDLESPYVFQGMTAKNKALVKALEEQLNHKIKVHKLCEFMGAVGIAIAAKIFVIKGDKIGKTNFKGFKVKDLNIKSEPFICNDCTNKCKITKIIEEGKVIAHLGSKCGKWR